MTLLELAAYFEEIASRHLLLQHDPSSTATACFFTLNTDKNADEFIRNLQKETILVLMPPDKKMLPVFAENYNWDKHVAFMTLTRCGDITAQNITAAQNIGELIADDLVRQMIADRDILITGLELETLVMEPVGPISDSFYGYICLFKLVDQFNQYLPTLRLPLR